MADVIRGPMVFAGYNSLFRPILPPKPKPTDKPKFELISLFTFEAAKTPEFAALKNAVIAVAVARFGQAKFEEMVREQRFESPFKKDIGSKGYDPKVFEYRVSSSANEDYPPLIFDARRKGPDGKFPQLTDRREIYSGVKLVVSYSARAYGGLDTGWTPGVKLDLRNVAKVGDGDRLSGGGADGSEFGDLAPDEPSAPSAEEFANLLT